jgi:cobalt-zinc-cadmium resistance protein CzcA
VRFGGQFENFERAQASLKIVTPIVVAIIFAMLLVTFRDVRMALAVFVTVPFALTGGMLGLLLRDMPFSLSAAVGFIALGGVAVLNGVVIGQAVLARLAEGLPLERAVALGSVSAVRAVFTTTAAAALGFLPMAMSTGAGAEVQQPLATAVSVGVTQGAAITLLVLPGVLTMILRATSHVVSPQTRPAEDLSS